jgi:hemoglobin/transferrin/lactoferrin receptor protein
MKSLIIISVLFFYSIYNFAQTVNLQIQLIDDINKLAISNAEIQLSKSYFGTSDISGKSEFKKIKKGNYDLIVTHINYKEFTTQISVFSDTILTIKINPKSFKLNDVIVTSGRYKQNIDLVPFSISSIGKKEIQSTPSFTISDILKTESGISLLRDGIWGTEISIRGLNRANIVTLIDGNRIETATDLSARLSMFDLNNIERIEVIKGAASSLYGSGATGGIINIISKTGNYNNQFTLNGNYSGGFNSVNNFYSNGINLFASDKNWLTRISAIYRKADNTQTPQGELPNSQFEDNSVSALLQYKPVDNHEIKFDFQQFRAINVGIPGGAPLFPANAKVIYPEEIRRLYSLEYKITNISSKFLKLTAKYFHQFISRDVKNIPNIVQYAPAENELPFRKVSVLGINPGADHNVDGFQTQADFSFTNHYLIAGLDFWKRNYVGLRSRDQKIDMLNSSDSSVVSTIYKTTFDKPLPDATFNSAGIYAQDEIKLKNKIDLTIGGRYDFIWLHNSKTVNPLYEINNGIVNNNPSGQFVMWDAGSARNKSYVFNVGIVYSLSENSNIAFNAANSFRSPSLEERYQYIDLGNLIRVGNPDLQPEQGYFLDLGFRYFPENINFRTSIFFNSFNDLVSQVPGIFEGRNALINTNIGKAQLYGFEYSLNFSPIASLNLFNTLSYVRGINTLDNSSLPEIAPLNGILGIKFIPYNWLAAEFSAVVFAAQNKVAVGENTISGYAYYNLSFNFIKIKVATLNLNLSTGIENIFNKEYRNHLSTDRGLIFSEPGRNFYLRTNIEF